MILPISAFQVTRITGVSHQHLAGIFIPIWQMKKLRLMMTRGLSQNCQGQHWFHPQYFPVQWASIRSNADLHTNAMGFTASLHSILLFLRLLFSQLPPPKD
jgi:hypothetical protein